MVISLEMTYEDSRGGKLMAEIIKNPDAPVITTEERVAALERKMKEMEALVKGLTEELLDLKSIAMRLNKFSEERRQELKMMKPSAQPEPGSGTVVMQKKGTAPERVAAPVVEEKHMDMIMQPDGTMKMEERRGDNHYIVASAGFASRKKMGSSPDPKKSSLIVAEDDDKESSKK
jgi:hypothetical protein